MGEKEMPEIAGAPEIYVDGFTGHTLRDGVMTCVGYRTLTEGKVVVLRLVWPVVNTISAIDDANAAMNTAEQPIQDSGGGRGGTKRIH